MDMNGEFSVGADEEAQMEAPQVCPEKTVEDCSVDLSDEGTGRAMYVKGPKITRGDSAGTSARNGWSTGGTETIPGIPERVPRRIPQVCPEDEGREASESAQEEEAAGRFPWDGRKATPRGDRETSPGAADRVAAAADSAARDPEGGTAPAPDPGTGGADAAKPCGNCRHLIAVSNLSLHETHCFRNLLVCARCEERVPRAEMEEHMQSEHTEVTCKCGKALERCKLEDHVVQECPRQAALCRYCGLEQPRATTREHEDFCGARTERCAACLVYVQKQDEEEHRLTCPGHPVAARDPARAITDAANASLAALRALHDDPNVMSEYEEFLKLLDSDDDEDEEGSPLGGRASASSLREMMMTAAAAAAAQFTMPGLPSSTQGGGGAEEEEEEGEATQLLLEDDQELLPCEFCSKPVPAHELVLHQSGCNPDVAHARVRYSNGVPTSGPSPPAAAAAQPPGEQLPCQYCYEPVAAPLLQAHQDRCLKEQESAFARLRNQHPVWAPSKDEPEPLDIGVTTEAAAPVADEEMTEMAPSSSSADAAETSVSPGDVKEMETSAPLEDPGSAF